GEPVGDPGLGMACYSWKWGSVSSRGPAFARLFSGVYAPARKVAGVGGFCRQGGCGRASCGGWWGRAKAAAEKWRGERVAGAVGISGPRVAGRVCAGVEG